MMVQLISQKQRIARKDYMDDCQEDIEESLDQIRNKLSWEEIKAIQIAQTNNWRILKGTPYDCQVCVLDGRVYNFRSHLGIIAICQKHHLFNEDY